MDSYLVKPRIYMDREGLTEILQGRKKAFIVTDRFMHESGKVSYITDICARIPSFQRSSRIRVLQL